MNHVLIAWMTQLGREKAMADAIDCEESRNDEPFLEHTEDNANFRNVAD